MSRVADTPEIRQAKKRAYREANKDHLKAYLAKYNQEHKEAHRARGKTYREANREKKMLSQRAYRAANQEMITHKRLVAEYGITLDQYNALFETQGKACAICRSTSPGNGKACWHTDHSHTTGSVRGILCHNCNVMLGHAKEDVVILTMAITYLTGGVQ